MYKVDKKWEETYQQQVVDILTQLMSHLAKIALASTEKDRTCATDFELQLVGGTVAVRLRRPDCKFRDLTIRVHRDNGKKTELAKIKEGHAFRYFYGWADDHNAIAEWMLVNLDRLRESGLLEVNREWHSNRDGTHFISISRMELYKAGCLLASNFNGKHWEVKR